MNIHAMTLREALAHLEGELRQLLTHPEATGQDKASIILASTSLTEIERRHLGRWTPVNPKTLPPRQPGQSFPKLPKGWAVDWEEKKEAANA